MARIPQATRDKWRALDNTYYAMPSDVIDASLARYVSQHVKELGL